jgi:hypothetical protein
VNEEAIVHAGLQSQRKKKVTSVSEEAGTSFFKVEEDVKQ